MKEEEEEEKKKKKILPGVLTYHTAAKRIANVGVHVKPSEARYRGSNNRRLRRCPKLCFSQDARRRSREEKKRSEAEPRRSVDSEERDCDRRSGQREFVNSFTPLNPVRDSAVVLSVSVCFCAVVSEPPQAMEASGVIAERLLGMRLVGMRFLVLVAACLIPTVKGIVN
ncbi:hypothetical protein G5I_01722 [Acromyrmex echinatior]|uniref:Uncharacterized protein n=1 Tax=Acromyrmex echinatior TaxID=103372 RepID=F4W8E1_ACREC|nr:hypothetical protein G5I_01722 [Acromyrmex echinatior]